MDLTNLKLFAMTAKRMDWLSKRQVVLSHNIANSDTGKYQPRDLKPLGFRDLLQRRTEQRGLQKTDAMHINATRVPEKYRPDSKKDAYETAPSGNAVIIEEQLSKISETQADHRLATNIYTKHVGMLKTALGRPPR
tara:strand:- start:1312 stop:1719 length:408 start_codon:yes stop_codon:yes gene_type:complete